MKGEMQAPFVLILIELCVVHSFYGSHGSSQSRFSSSTSRSFQSGFQSSSSPSRGLRLDNSDWRVRRFATSTNEVPVSTPEGRLSPYQTLHMLLPSHPYHFYDFDTVSITISRLWNGDTCWCGSSCFKGLRRVTEILLATPHKWKNPGLKDMS